MKFRYVAEVSGDTGQEGGLVSSAGHVVVASELQQCHPECFPSLGGDLWCLYDEDVCLNGGDCDPMTGAIGGDGVHGGDGVPMMCHSECFPGLGGVVICVHGGYESSASGEGVPTIPSNQDVCGDLPPLPVCPGPDSFNTKAYS